MLTDHPEHIRVNLDSRESQYFVKHIYIHVEPVFVICIYGCFEIAKFMSTVFSYRTGTCIVFSADLYVAVADIYTRAIPVTTCPNSAALLS